MNLTLSFQSDWNLWILLLKNSFLYIILWSMSWGKCPPPHFFLRRALLLFVPKFQCQCFMIFKLRIFVMHPKGSGRQDHKNIRGLMVYQRCPARNNHYILLLKCTQPVCHWENWKLQISHSKRPRTLLYHQLRLFYTIILIPNNQQKHHDLELSLPILPSSWAMANTDLPSFPMNLTIVVVLCKSSNTIWGLLKLASFSCQGFKIHPFHSHFTIWL